MRGIVRVGANLGTRSVSIWLVNVDFAQVKTPLKFWGAYRKSVARVVESNSKAKLVI